MRISKKMAAVLITGVATVSLAGGAFAFYTATGTATSNATSGTSSPWLIDSVVISGNGGTLNPGSGQQAVDYRVTNKGTGIQNLSSVILTVQADANGYVVGAPGCEADWFGILNSWPGANFQPVGQYAPNEVRDGHAVIGMNNGDGAGENQDACKGMAIPLVLNAN